MKNENKNVTFTDNVFFFYRNGLSGQGHFKELMAYLRYHVQ